LSRRGRGEGSIRERADGRWEAIIDLGRIDGKRKRLSIYAATRREVSVALNKRLSDRRNGLPVAIERQTVGSFLQTWLEDTIKPTARPRSYESFGTIIRKHLGPSIGHIQLAALTPQDVQLMMKQKSDAGFSPQTVAQIRTVLRSALNQALRWRLVSWNVAALVDPPRIPKREHHALDAAGAKKLLEVAHGERYEAAYFLGLMSGLRRGEILGLRWTDIDLERATLHVTHSLQRVEGVLQLADVKTDKSVRAIQMPASVVEALRAQRARQLEAALRWHDSGLVFTNEGGGPVQPITLHRDYKRLLAKAGLPDATRLHDLRHSAASLLLNQDVPLTMISRLLGHSSISITGDIYGHIMPASNRRMADTMEALLNPVMKVS
jgi:integrase